MGLLEIAVSVAAALLVGALARGIWRPTLLLVLSVLAVYWFQPVIPLRSFAFWLPTLTLYLAAAAVHGTSPAAMAARACTHHGIDPHQCRQRLA